ncbi:MAG: hypothetical protein ABIN91_06650 [Mucilaginibacter sp.]|uniref:hypothetical protein n=1 Tax=Mucilaginibacter sp. TaxID=1882438 RepID=UPI003263836A
MPTKKDNSAAIKKAEKFLAVCENEIRLKNGNKPITDKEAKTLNELQHAIGSQHSIHIVKYKQAKDTVVEIIRILNL